MSSMAADAHHHRVRGEQGTELHDERHNLSEKYHRSLHKLRHTSASPGHCLSGSAIVPLKPSVGHTSPAALAAQILAA